MGNGIIENINDVIFVDIDVFDKGDTVQMTYEIEKLNKMFAAENKKYLLIGPGRWGTRDQWIGIPVELGADISCPCDHRNQPRRISAGRFLRIPFFP